MNEICSACAKNNFENSVCGFNQDGNFSENWNCGTLNLLRELVYEGKNAPDGVSYRYCEDMKYATVDVSDVDDVDGALALWVSWYKNRGKTDAAILLFSDSQPREVTEAECLAILDFYKEKIG